MEGEKRGREREGQALRMRALSARVSSGARGRVRV